MGWEYVNDLRLYLWFATGFSFIGIVFVFLRVYLRTHISFMGSGLA